MARHETSQALKNRTHKKIKPKNLKHTEVIIVFWLAQIYVLLGVAVLEAPADAFYIKTVFNREASRRTCIRNYWQRRHATRSGSIEYEPVKFAVVAQRQKINMSLLLSFDFGSSFFFFTILPFMKCCEWGKKNLLHNNFFTSLFYVLTLVDVKNQTFLHSTFLFTSTEYVLEII